MLRNLAAGFKAPISERYSAGSIARELGQRGAITPVQFRLIMAIIKLCNAAIHGRRVSLEEAGEVLDVAAVLRDQYVSWLTWGFPGDSTTIDRHDEE